MNPADKDPLKLYDDAAVKTITMHQLRQNSGDVVNQLRKGVRLLLTYRGKPLARLEPVGKKPEIREDDPLYHLHLHADPNLKPLTNKEIDKILYS